MRVFLLSIILFACLPMAAASEFPEYKSVTISMVKDGDTVTALIEVWPKMHVKTDVRVAGVNTPEKRFPLKACTAKYSRDKCLELSRCEKELGYKATDFAKLFVNRGSCSVVDVDPSSTKYAGRINADIICRGQRLSAALLDAGHARRYDGGTRGFWCE